VRTPLLFLNVLLVATCGLIYELLAGTLASYVLGDSITQFSLIIGIYLSAMGVGAWISRFFAQDLARRFIDVELGVALVGGLSAPLLFVSFARLSWFKVVLYGDVFVIGALVGLELPLLMRILKDRVEFKDLVSRIFTFDYLGALVASLLFPIFFVPRLGLVRTSLVFGLVNAAVGLWGTWLLSPLLEAGRGVLGLRVRGAAVVAILMVGIVQADRLTSLSEDQLFADPIVYSATSAYQRIVITHNRAGFQLFLNGNLQFSSADEYRYHEALVHPAMAAAAAAAPVKRVLVLGGGDGLAVRELLRHPSIEEITLVDLDPAMTQLADRFAPLRELSQNALRDARVHVINDDAMVWLEQPAPSASATSTSAPFDVAIVDFPDPNSFALGKLYTTRFYRLLKRRLAPTGAIAVQATSPLFARTSYWCVVRTMEAAGLSVHPYQTAVPSFGIWGYVLARTVPFEPPTRAPLPLRFLNDEGMRALFVFPADLGPVPVDVNRLDNQSLVRYYESEWRRWQ
jgi:spermidine synthase